MALNDYADRDLDRLERPERPIPSGRVRPSQALGMATVLTCTGIAVAGLAGGTRALRVAVPLAATVWAYDLVAKPTGAGPVAMAAARGLDVLMGAGGRTRAAALPALAVAVHTAAVTGLSRGEVHGSSAAAARAALAGTASAAALAAVPGRSSAEPESAAAAALALSYVTTVGRRQADAARNPDATTVRRATGAGVRGVIALQSALAARAGSLRLAAGILAAGPLARLGARAVSPT
jgi:4-hydroxybenzoate polyprenyltransferase